MIKYYCDRCRDEVKAGELFAIGTDKNDKNYDVCKECLKEFESWMNPPMCKEAQ